MACPLRDGLEINVLASADDATKAWLVNGLLRRLLACPLRDGLETNVLAWADDATKAWLSKEF